MADLIDRQAAIDFIDAGHFVNPNEPRWSDNEVVNFLKSRPTAEPERTQDAIDRQAAIEAIADTLKYEDYGFLSDELESVINNVPTADVVKVRKPDHGYMWLCPECGLEVHSDYDRCVRCGWERRTDG